MVVVPYFLLQGGSRDSRGNCEDGGTQFLMAESIVNPIFDVD